MKKFNVIGIDLAKNVMQVCKIDQNGELHSNKAMSPTKLKELLAKSKPSIVAMEGCGSCHYWARLAREFGHDVRIISPKKVKAYLQGHKTDANDALAIAVASLQCGVIFSQIKEIDQQTLQTLETSRKFLDRERIALSNHIRAYVYLITHNPQPCLKACQALAVSSMRCRRSEESYLLVESVD
ncbi:Mobile element protein [hydrothermal vent metagenome]|uniref:Mobile element protein n=1 Tax=hydrothermal vent metagenome TaxID=652676 RepID=A0A3B1C3P7_9ZZZZ